MRRVIVSTLMTLDGKYDASQRFTIPFDHEDSNKYHAELLAGADGLLLGRTTYQMFAALWPPRAGGSAPYADTLNGMPKYVVSNTLKDLPWENSHLLGGDLAERVGELKAQDGGDLVVYGSPTLVRGLQEQGLVDEYQFLLHPAMLGNGESVMDGGVRVNLELVEATPISHGVLALTYRPVK